MLAGHRDKNRRTKALIKHLHAIMKVTRVSEVACHDGVPMLNREAKKAWLA